MHHEPRSVAAIFPPVIQIYSFAPDPRDTIIPVQPLDSDYMDDTTARPALVAQLELPRFAPGVIVGAFDVRPDPAFPPNRDSAGTRKPFTQNPEKGVLVFELQVTEHALNTPPEALETRAYELVVLRETLVDMAREGEKRLATIRKAAKDQVEYPYWRVEENFAWAEWGEKKARMMDMSMTQRRWVGQKH